MKKKFPPKAEIRKSVYFIIKMIINWVAAAIFGWAICRWYVMSFGGKFPKTGVLSDRLLGLMQDLGGGALIIGILTIILEIYRSKGRK